MLRCDDVGDLDPPLVQRNRVRVRAHWSAASGTIRPAAGRHRYQPHLPTDRVRRTHQGVVGWTRPCGRGCIVVRVF
jgi:hypothetical protein